MRKMRVGIALVVSAFIACFTQAQVAKVGNTTYDSIDAAIGAWTNGSTLTLLADVTLSDVIKLSSTEYHVLDLGTYTMTAAKNKNAIEYVIHGRTSASYALDIKADATNPGGITATGKSIVVHTKPSSGAPSKDRPITRFYGGVFNASTIVKQNGGFLGLGAGYTGSNAPYFYFYGGTFNGAIATNRSQNQFHGGMFNGQLQMSVDSSAYTLVLGGKFKYLSNVQGSNLDEKIAQGVDHYKFTIGSAKATYDRGIYVDKDGYYVITSAPITEVSVKYPAVYKKTYGGDDYFYYSAAQANGLFYEDTAMAIENHGEANVTVYKQEVTAATGVTAPEGVANNTAIEDFPVEVPEEVAKFEIQLVEVAGEATEPTKVVFNVEPKAADGTKVSTPASAITFRLPVPAAWTGMVKVSHEGALMGTYAIQEAEGAKYVELTSASFSEFALEQVAPVVKIGDTPYATLADAVAAAQAGETIVVADNFDLGEISVNKQVTLDLNGKVITATGNYFFYLLPNAELTIKDSSETKSGTLKGVNADGTAGVGNAFLVYEGSTLKIESGIIHAYNNVICTYGEGIVVNISGGELKSFLQDPAGAPLYLAGTQSEVTLSGGTFIGPIYNWNDKLSISGGQFTVDVTSYCAPGYKAQKNTATGYYEVVEDRVETVDPSVAQAMIVLGGEDKYYATLADALKAAQDESATDLVITLMGTTTATSAVTFDLVYKTVFNSVTFKQADATQPYFVKELYTGARVNDGAFIFDGVNIAIPSNGQYMFEGNVKLINNATITSTAEANCFVYYADVTIEPGSKLNGVIDDIRGGTLTVDGGKTDGTYSATPDMQDAILYVNWADSKLVIKNGAYVKVNAVNEIGRLTINGVVEVTDAKLEAHEYIAIAENATMTVDSESEITTGKLTGKGKLTIDATNFASSTKTLIKANMSDFTGTIEVVGNDLVSCEKTSEGIVIKASLAGAGTEANPYQIGSLAELELFRDSVNAGETKYSAPGVYVALTADIDMAGINWVGIGSINQDHGFMGNFDGKTFKIKNLTITNPALDSDGYAYAGLFSITEGTDQNNQNTIKNLTIENVTINTTGHIVSAAIAYPYYTIVENVKVCGDINITGGDYTAGALAYTRRCVNASDISVIGNDATTSIIAGGQTVGGVISDIQMNGGLTAVYSNFKAENLTIKGTSKVGGISGIIATQTLNGATVKKVTLVCPDRVGQVAGSFGGTCTISDVVVEDVTGATVTIGAGYKDGAAVQAKIGDTYYASLQTAIDAAGEGDTIMLTADISYVNVSSTADTTTAINIPEGKKFTLDLNGYTISGENNVNSGFAFMTICRGADVTIDDTSANETGKITYKSTREVSNYNEMGYTIRVKGALILNNGTIENSTPLGSDGFEKCVTTAIDIGNASGAMASFTMNDGVVISNTYFAIRANVYGDNNSSVTDAVVLNGGTVYGLHFCDWGSSGLNYKVTIGNDAIIECGKYVDYLDQAIRLVIGSAARSEIVVDIAENAQVKGTIYCPAAKVGNRYFYSIQKAIDAAQAGDTIELLADTTATDVILIGKSIKINGNGHKVTSSATRVFRVTTANTEVTLNGVNMVSTAVRVGTNDVRGISIDIVDNVKLTLNNCSVDFTDASANDWAYAVNVTGGSNHILTVNGGTYEGANVINVRGANHTVAVQNATLNSTYPENNQYYGAGIWVQQEQGSSVSATGNTFNGSNAVAFNLGTGTTLTESNNTDNTVRYITGEGTESDPYLIKDVKQLVLFRDSVNAGETKYNASGVYVALGADIDMAGIDWSVNIGDAADTSFDGIFDGKGKTIRNLKSVESAKDPWGYICTGLFGCIAGEAQVKNLTLENVDITAGYVGNNVAALVGFAYSCTGTIDNVTVKNVTINATNATGVGAIVGYDYYSPALKVTNCTVDGTSIAGAAYVGGVIGYASTKIQLNNNTVKNLTLSGTASVGGVAGIMLAGGSASGNTIDTVNLSATGAMWANSVGAVAGTMTNGAITVAGTTVSGGNVADIVGGILVEKPTTPIEKVQAKIGDTYYTTFEGAAAAATAGQGVTLLVPPTADEDVEITAGQLTGAAAYDAATLLGGTFKKTAEGTLHYDYAFGVSNVTYKGGDDFTLTIAIEDADSNVARTLTGRTLLIDMKVDGAVVETFTVTNPAFVAANGQVTCDVDVELPTLTLGNGEGKATYFEVKVSDAAVVAP